MELILVRGLPGSGKSTLAKMIASQKTGMFHIETDQYWINRATGAYEFVPERIKDAHQWCQDNVWNHLDNGYSVVLSNTFTQAWEMQPYFDMAKDFDIVPQVILCQNQYGNIHNVPDEILVKMSNRFEYDISELFK
jgi:predicted kinase